MSRMTSTRSAVLGIDIGKNWSRVMRTERTRHTAPTRTAGAQGAFLAVTANAHLMPLGVFRVHF